MVILRIRVGFRAEVQGELAKNDDIQKGVVPLALASLPEHVPVVWVWGFGLEVFRQGTMTPTVLQLRDIYV